MSTKTANLKLIKPEATDNVKLSDINENMDKIDSEFGRVLLRVYPVGSIYMSVNPTSPAELFGGTWEEFGKGRTLVGVDTTQAEFNTVEKTGGAKTHTLTVNEIPAHNHEIMSGYILEGGTNLSYDVINYSRWNINSPGFKSADLFMSKTGGGQPHNNMPPYLVVNIWKRVA